MACGAAEPTLACDKARRRRWGTRLGVRGGRRVSGWGLRVDGREEEGNLACGAAEPTFHPNEPKTLVGDPGLAAMKLRRRWGTRGAVVRNADSPFDCAQGMTERKARATANATATADSPFDCAQGNDRKKGKGNCKRNCNSKRRFPAGMTKKGQGQGHFKRNCNSKRGFPAGMTERVAKAKRLQ